MTFFFRHLEDYVTWKNTQNTKVAKVPYLSLQILTENIDILLNAARHNAKKLERIQQMNETSKTIKAITESKISILEGARSKSESLADIEKRKMKNLEIKINESNTLIDHLAKKFDKYKNLVQKETENFKKGVTLATTLALAEAAAETANTFFAIFSGNFNPAKAIRAATKVKTLATLLKKILKVMKSLGKLIKEQRVISTLFKSIKRAGKSQKKKLSSFFGLQIRIMKGWLASGSVNKHLSFIEKIKVRKFITKTKKNYKTLKGAFNLVEAVVSYLRAQRAARASYDKYTDNEYLKIGNDSHTLATYAETKKVLENNSSAEALEKGKTLNAVDVFKWKIAREHITGMMDATLSSSVPEAAGYRTALLKLIMVGETRTQASLDLVSLQLKYAESDYAYQKYIDEAISIAVKISDSKDENVKAEGEKQRELQLTILDAEWEEFEIKLQILKVNEEYCDSYYYFHLQHCPLDLQIHPTDDLVRIQSIQNMLLYKTNEKLKELYPAPQTFTDRTITIEKAKHCHCLQHFENFDTDALDDRSKHIELRDKMQNDAKECLKRDSVKYPNDDNVTAHNIITNEIMKKCSDSIIEKVKKDLAFSYKVSIDSPDLFGRERVRVDEIKVAFVGAKTSSGIVETHVDSTGLYEDRFHGNCFKFVGSKWKRVVSYKAPNSDKAVDNVDYRTSKSGIIAKALKRIEMKIDDIENDAKYIDHGDIHKGFEGVYNVPTPFSIWTFVIPEERNKGLDLSGLERIEIIFSGSFVATDYSVSPVECELKDADIDAKDVDFKDEL